MGRGIGLGFVWGLLVSAVVLAVISLSSPLPPRPEAETIVAAEPAPEPMPQAEPDAAPAPAMPAEAPEAAEPEAAEPEAMETEAPADTQADMPAESAAQEPQGPAEDARAPAMPSPDPAPEATPATEAATATAAAPADSVPLPAGSEFNRPPPEQEAALPATDTAPATAAPAATTIPEAGSVTLPPATDTAPPPQPSATAALDLPRAGAPAPDIAAAAPLPDTAADPLAPPPELQPAPLGLPQIETAPPATTPSPAPVAEEGGDAGAMPAPAPAPAAEARAQNGTALSPRLPTISDAPATPGGAILSPAAPPEVATALPEAPRRAIEAHAAAFDAAETRPLMAVILIDDPSFGLDRSVLTRFTFPVTFAVDPTRPGAAESARAYRDAGFEVVLWGGLLPDGAAPGDVEVALAGAVSVVPEAVAVLDTPEGRIQGNRPVLDALVGALQESGHGLVAFPQGLNAAEQSAARVGVPAATLFRAIDADRERATIITRYLDRAAFAAAQEGSVIVVGHTYSDTVTAIYSWALGNRSESVALAPVSAVLTRGE